MHHLLPLLPKPSRYIGVEDGSVRKPAEQVSFRIGLAFPDMYEVGMSYLGHHILYGIINDIPHMQAERVFTPCRDAGEILRRHKTPLCTLECDTPLHKLDALGFSLTHELCFTNVLYMLDLGGIPLRAADRLGVQEDGTPWPLVIAGGGCTLAAEPLTPFVDVMILGEGEEALPELVSLLEEHRRGAWDRSAFLRKAAGISGIYVPEFFEAEKDPTAAGAWVRPLYPDHTSVTRRVIPDMNKAPYPKARPIAFGAVHNRLALEIGRGCTRGCRFCQAGTIYRPARERGVEELHSLLTECLGATGYDEVSFLSLSTGDFSALKELFLKTADRCAAEQISLSLPSLRVGSIDDAVMERMAGIRRTGATLAPEAGSARLRAVINKGVTEEDLILHVQKLFEHGWRQVKLYFMIGLPTETDEDLLGIVDLCRKARDAAGPGIKSMNITAAVSPFVPKPHTPFHREAQISRDEIRRRVGVLLDAVRGEKRIKLRWHEPDMSTLEGVFSRGDRRLANVVESAYRKGAIFSSWMEGFNLAPWLESLEEYGLAVDEFLAERPEGFPLPWAHLKSGVSDAFLERERRNALAEKTITDCRYTTCHACGVCDLKNSPSLLDRAPLKDEDGYRNRLNRPARDQESHKVELDQYGRVIIRRQEGEEPSSGGKAKPPALAPHLGEKVAQLRLWYAKEGPAIFLSQLELQSIFERALRRAGAPLSFSKGFHPLPLISFARALPVGVAGEAERLTLYLRERFSLPELFAGVNKSLPRGLKLTSVEELDLKKNNPDEATEYYRVQARKAEDAPALQKAFAAFAALEMLPWERETKKGTRSLDARALAASVNCTKDGSVSLTFDWTNGYVSPLALCMHILESCGFSEALPRVLLTKTARPA